MIDFNFKILKGHILDVIPKIPDNYINLIVTSPPYWGLRDYGGDDIDWYDGWIGKLGQEPTYQLYIEHLRYIFDKLRSKLREDGSLWINIGETYGGGGGIGVPNGYEKSDLREIWNIDDDSFDRKNFEEVYPGQPPQAKLKDMAKSQIGIPERLKIALIDDGWICRNTIIWKKTNPMIFPIKDRFTPDFEHFYFFTKNKNYYFEQQLEGKNGKLTRNMRTTWTIPVARKKYGHFAIFPRKLLEIPVKACCPSKICTKCDSPVLNVYEIVKRIDRSEREDFNNNIKSGSDNDPHKSLHTSELALKSQQLIYSLVDTKKCNCNAEFRSGIVLDPFNGSGTTGEEALRQRKNYIGIEINPKDVKYSRDSLAKLHKKYYYQSII